MNKFKKWIHRQPYIIQIVLKLLLAFLLIVAGLALFVLLFVIPARVVYFAIAGFLLYAIYAVVSSWVERN